MDATCHIKIEKSKSFAWCKGEIQEDSQSVKGRLWKYERPLPPVNMIYSTIFGMIFYRFVWNTLVCQTFPNVVPFFVDRH